MYEKFVSKAKVVRVRASWIPQFFLNFADSLEV